MEGHVVHALDAVLLPLDEHRQLLGGGGVLLLRGHSLPARGELLDDIVVDAKELLFGILGDRYSTLNR